MALLNNEEMMRRSCRRGGMIRSINHNLDRMLVVKERVKIMHTYIEADKALEVVSKAKAELAKVEEYIFDYLQGKA